MEKSVFLSDTQFKAFALLVNRLIDEGGEPLYRRCIEKYNPFLNSAQVRELAQQGLLDSPNAPRPMPRLIANQTTVILHTYHRARLSSPTKELAGEWNPREKTIPLTPHIATVLLARFRGEVAPTSRKHLLRVANGMKAK